MNNYITAYNKTTNSYKLYNYPHKRIIYTSHSLYNMKLLEFALNSGAINENGLGD